jgi:hypothetical protein
VLRSASVMRPGHFFLLALLIGFLSYRAALATFPSERMWAQTPEGRVDTHFDAVTGIMVSPPAYAYPESGMYAHWFRSAMFGFAVVPLSFIALWWLARRRRADRQRRPDALSGITTTLALALCLVGCAGEPRLLRGEMTTCGWIGPWPWVSGVLLSGPVNGTAIKVDGTGSGYLLPPIGSIVPVAWTADVSARWLIEGEVEIRNSVGTVAVRTGTRVSIAPPVPIVDNPVYHQGEPFPTCDARSRGRPLPGPW